MMITRKTMSRTVQTNAAHTVENITRRGLNTLLYEIYGCREAGVSNDVVADTTLAADDIVGIEVFNSPQGLLVAMLHGPTANDVTLIRPISVAKPAISPDDALANPPHGHDAPDGVNWLADQMTRAAANLNKGVR